MANRRELSRREARRQRATAKSEAREMANANCALAEGALKHAARVVVDPSFVGILLRHGVQSIPRCLGANGDTLEQGIEITLTHDRLERISLEFAIAWRFLYPLLSEEEAKAYLETAWPGFIAEMKDAFIALVVEGPFSQAMSGHRGRKHHGQYSGK